MLISPRIFIIRTPQFWTNGASSVRAGHRSTAGELDKFCWHFRGLIHDIFEFTEILLWFSALMFTRVINGCLLVVFRWSISLIFCTFWIGIIYISNILNFAHFAFWNARFSTRACTNTPLALIEIKLLNIRLNVWLLFSHLKAVLIILMCRIWFVWDVNDYFDTQNMLFIIKETSNVYETC